MIFTHTVHQGGKCRIDAECRHFPSFLPFFSFTVYILSFLLHNNSKFDIIYRRMFKMLCGNMCCRYSSCVITFSIQDTYLFHQNIFCCEYFDIWFLKIVDQQVFDFFEGFNNFQEINKDCQSMQNLILYQGHLIVLPGQVIF